MKVREIAEEVAGPLSVLDSCVDQDGLDEPCVWERIVWRLQKAGLLDAILIQDVCATCGGTGRFYHPEEKRSLVCPDCGGQRNAVVIEQGPWEAFVCGCVWLKAKTKEKAGRKWDMPHQSLGELLPGEPDNCTFDEWWAWAEGVAVGRARVLFSSASLIAREILYDLHTDTDGDACPTYECYTNPERTEYRQGGMLLGTIAILEDSND